MYRTSRKASDLRSAAQTFQLPGSYLNSSGATVTSVTLAPTTGLILQSAS